MTYQTLPDYLTVQREAIPFTLSNYGNTGQQPAIGMDLSNLTNGGAAQPGMFDRATGWMNQNGQMLSNIANGAGAVFGIWDGMRNYRLAKDSFNLQKKAFETNLRNSTKTYNTALEDRIRGRSSEQSEADIQAYLAKNRL